VEKTAILPIPVITKNNFNAFFRPDLPNSFWCGTRLPNDIVKKLFSR
jgi:hypothetical protein